MLNMEMDQRIVINSNEIEWQPSPARGVARKPLAREAAEHGHATSIVAYEPGSSFETHQHPFGEEILVLDGVFSDASGDFKQGTYLRNPPGSSHAPFSKDGCRLLVKLHQFQSDDKKQVCIDTQNTPWLQGQGGLEIMPLHQFGSENVALVKWPKGEHFKPHTHFGGEEIYVISGTFIDEYGRYPAGTWIRSPHMSHHHPYVEEETVIWVKTGHLTGSEATSPQ